jgi:hypothetical protein
MNTLRQFSEKEKNYFAYQARQDYIRQQNSIRFDYESEIQAAKQREQTERSEKEAAIQREQKALVEIERLTALLKKQ